MQVSTSQIGADGRRSQIFLALSTAAEFRDHLSAFSDFYASLGNLSTECLIAKLTKTKLVASMLI